MNESDLENELRALRPAAPSQGLEARIAMELHTQAVVPAKLLPTSTGESLLSKILRPLFWASAGAAAAVAVMNARPAMPPASTPPATVAAAEMSEPAPPETTRELLAAEQSGIRYEADRGLVREVRASYLEHHAWTDPRTGGRVEIVVPREDVFLQPIAMQ